MDSKDKIFSAFANRYPSESHKILSLRRADWCAEAEPLGQPAEHHYELPVEVARVIYEAGWKDSLGGSRWISVDLCEGVTAGRGQKGVRDFQRSHHRR